MINGVNKTLRWETLDIYQNELSLDPISQLKLVDQIQKRIITNKRD